jgi:hypothetical protein
METDEIREPGAVMKGTMEVNVWNPAHLRNLEVK